MQLWEVKEILEAELLWEPIDLQLEIEMAEAADLMSDVLNRRLGCDLLITGLVNSQVIRTAEMADIKAIAFVRGKMPDQEAITLAKSKGIPLLTTKLLMYEACARLAMKGLTGSSGTI
ncbi:MAG: hypothetical protein A2Y65_10625 [Deltaproteobacteria bacterium RBG_13_52_11]|nr:MAG: hypothetical protein A2Y65_10625 [Deltaproteobacteria bacterium RBG_13_52_11]